MSDLEDQLRELAHRAGARAAVLLETSGIEVAAWGEADAETVAAEFAELWRRVKGAEAPGVLQAVRGLAIEGTHGTWVATALADDYLLAVLAAPSAVPGRARFYASEWAQAHRGEFT